MTIATLLAIAQTQLGQMSDVHPWLVTNGVSLVCAMATVESGRRDLEPYQDGKTKAWGCFAMHLDRWKEISNLNDWGKASPSRQVEVFLRWANHTARKAEVCGQPYLPYLCACQNGHGSKRQRAMYLAKVKAAWP